MSIIDGYSADNIDTLLSHKELDTVTYGLHILSQLCTTVGEYEALIGKVKIIQGKIYPPKAIQSYPHKTYITLWFIGKKASLSKAYAKKVHTLTELSLDCLPDTLASLSHLRAITIQCSVSYGLRGKPLDGESMLGEDCSLRGLALESVTLYNYTSTTLPAFLKGSQASLRALLLPRARKVLTLPDWLGDFSKLETLTGQDGINLSTASLPVLYRLKTLKKLSFHQDAKAFPAGVLGLTALEDLQICFQHVSSKSSKWDCVLPDRFSELPKLKKLTLMVNPASSIPRPLSLPDGLLRQVFSNTLELKTSRSSWNPKDQYQPTIEKFEVQEFINTGQRRQLVRGTVQTVPAHHPLQLRFRSTLEGLTGTFPGLTEVNLNLIEQMSAAAWEGLLAFPDIQKISLPCQTLLEEMTKLPRLRSLDFTLSQGTLAGIEVLSRCRSLKTLTYRQAKMTHSKAFHQNLAHLDAVSIVSASFPPECSVLYEDSHVDASGELAFRYSLDLRPSWALSRGVVHFRNQQLEADFQARRRAELGALRLQGILDGLAKHPERLAEYEAGGLHSLDLSGMKLETLPESVDLLQSLRSLNLANNTLRSLPDSLFTLSTLQTLDLSGNRLVDLPEDIADLSQLQTLNLANNSLITLPPELGECAQLRHLDLSNNPFAALPMALVSDTAIESLQLRGCSNLKDAWLLAGMPALKNLDLHGCTALAPKVSPKTMSSRDSVAKAQLKLSRWLKRQKERTPEMERILTATAAIATAQEEQKKQLAEAERRAQAQRDEARRIAQEREKAQQQRYQSAEMKAAAAVLGQRFSGPACSAADIALLQEHAGAMAALITTEVVTDDDGWSTVTLPEQEDASPWLQGAGLHRSHAPLLALMIAARSGALAEVTKLALSGASQTGSTLSPAVLAGLKDLQALRLRSWAVVGDWTDCAGLKQLSELTLHAAEPPEDFSSLKALPALRRVAIVQPALTAAQLASLPLASLDRLELTIAGGLRTPTAALTHFAQLEAVDGRVILHS